LSVPKIVWVRQHKWEFDLGLYTAQGELIPVGSVGMGWNSDEAAALKQKLARIEQPNPPFAGGPKKPGRWSKSKPMASDGLSQSWSPNFSLPIGPRGQVRYALFLSVRSDKDPTSITREIAMKLTSDPKEE
jgi:bifunctional non-homologous end joining protein LigD